MEKNKKGLSINKDMFGINQWRSRKIVSLLRNKKSIDWVENRIRILKFVRKNPSSVSWSDELGRLMNILVIKIISEDLYSQFSELRELIRIYLNNNAVDIDSNLLEVVNRFRPAEHHGEWEIEREEFMQIRQRGLSRRKFVGTTSMAAVGVNLLPLSRFMLYENYLVHSIKNDVNMGFLEFIRSDNESNRIIILIKDIHSYPLDPRNWERDYERICRIRDVYKINVIGVEGWAGHDVDKKRGRRIINGEASLVKTLIEDQGFKVLGLEEENLQNLALYLSFWSAYLRVSSFDSFDLNKFTEMQRNGTATRFSEKLVIGCANDLGIELSDIGIEKVKRYISKELGYIPQREKSQRFKRDKKRIIEEKRSEYAAKYFVKCMVEERFGQAIMVFGKDHIQGIIDELRKEVNIILLDVVK